MEGHPGFNIGYRILDIQYSMSFLIGLFFFSGEILNDFFFQQ